MCTLTWQYTEHGYDLLFNRDELRSRAEALPPREVQPGILTPLDPQGGGSWIAVNRHGISVCLLNWYAADRRSSRTRGRFRRDAQQTPGRFGQPEQSKQSGQTAEPQYRSRGGIVLQAAEAKTLAEVGHRVHSLALTRYRPFLLWAIAPGQSPIMLRWNGRQLIEELTVSAPVTTSSTRTRRTLSRRRRLYNRMVHRAGSASHAVRLAYHRSRFRIFPHDSVAMQRVLVQTVSLTHIAVDAYSAAISYLPGNPAASRRTPKQPVQPADSNAPGSQHQRIARTADRPQQGSSPPRDIPESVLDLRAAFRSKNPQLARWMPNWVFGSISRLLQLRRIQRIITRLRLLPSRRFSDAALNSIGISGCITGSRPPSAAQRPVYVANHPLGGLDGLAMIQLLLRWYPEVRIVSNDILAGLPHLAPFLIPVDTYRSHRSLLRSLHTAFASDACILFFPAGRTARRHHGRLREFPWHKTALQLALQHQRPLVPVSIRARNSYWFYLIHRLRTWLGITWNLEMFLLPRELLRPACRQLHICRHAPLSPLQLTALGPTNRLRTAAVQAITERGVV